MRLLGYVMAWASPVTAAAVAVAVALAVALVVVLVGVAVQLSGFVSVLLVEPLVLVG